MQQNKKKILVIGWDAADWKIINTLRAQGLMPAIDSLITQGVSGNISTLEPPFSPMLWTSIATGKLADKHGVMGFSEPTPDHVGVRPVSSTSRKVKAVWNMLMQEGYHTHVLGWWPSHPAEPINGIMVSNHFQKAHVPQKKWKVPDGAVHPVELKDFFARFRIHPAELTHEHILPFVPNAAKVDQKKDKRLTIIAKNIAECSSLHAVATWIMEHQEWDFLAVYLDTIDHFCHGFMSMHPPRMPSVPEDLYEMYKDVVVSAYKYHDMMLETLLKLAGDDTTIVLLSDHGFHSDHLRPEFVPVEPAGPAFQHRDHGVLCIKGPGIKKGEIIHGASLLDITPTLLHLAHLPVGGDMDGKVLLDIFETQHAIQTIPSWEQIEGEAGRHPVEFVEDPFETQAALQQLVELGYIEDPGKDSKQAVEMTIREADYNLARVYTGSGRDALAIPIYEKLVAAYPKEVRFAFRLANCLQQTGNYDEALNTISNVRKIIFERQNNEETRKRIKEFKLPDDISEKAKEKLLRKHHNEVKTLQQDIRDLVRLDLLQSDIHIKLNRTEEALAALNKLSEIIPDQQSIKLQLASAYLKLNSFDAAIELYNSILSSNPEHYQSLHGLAIAHLRKEDYPVSVEYALRSIELHYANPVMHYHLGKALESMEMYEQAAEAYEVCLNFSPSLGDARNRLINIYNNHLNKSDAAETLKKYFYITPDDVTDVEETLDLPLLSETEKQPKNLTLTDPAIIVSGLPRSGTSLMMQILDAAGFTIFTDAERKADDSNPKGYYEHEAVKRLARDKKWMQDTKGKVVKIISHLLMQIPMNMNYKIVFMERDVMEVVMSQHQMLVRNGKAQAGVYPAGLDFRFKQNLAKVQRWLKLQHNIDVLYVSHKQLISNPIPELEKLQQFLGKTFDIQKTAEVIDVSLYRARK